MDITKMTALEIAQAIKSGAVTSADAVKAVLGKIEETDGSVNAYITVCGEQALNKAKEVQLKIESGELASPLAGVPVSIKDNICTKGIKTSCASKILGEFKPVYNATVIDRLEKAGLVIVGKLNMDEFSMGAESATSFYGGVKNPMDIKNASEGCPDGAAAALAAGEAAIALGSDTGGSIRRSASLCKATGFKPSYGTVSRYGLVAFASSMDQIGPIGKDVADCAALMDVIGGKDPLDATSSDIEYPGFYGALNGGVKGMKIGVLKESFHKKPDDTSRLIVDAAKIFEGLGASVGEVGFPLLDYAVPAHYIISCAEASSNMSCFDGIKYGFRSKNYDGLTELYSATRGEGFGGEVKKRVLFGTLALSAGYYDRYYQKALKVRALIKNSLEVIFEKYDIVLCPVLPAEFETGYSEVYTSLANMAGLPALSLPCGFDRGNMPVGIQLVGRRQSDDTVLCAGYAYQQNTDFHKIRPEVK